MERNIVLITIKFKSYPILTQLMNLIQRLAIGVPLVLSLLSTSCSNDAHKVENERKQNRALGVERTVTKALQTNETAMQVNVANYWENKLKQPLIKKEEPAPAKDKYSFAEKMMFEGKLQSYSNIFERFDKDAYMFYTGWGSTIKTERDKRLIFQYEFYKLTDKELVALTASGKVEDKERQFSWGIVETGHLASGDKYFFNFPNRTKQTNTASLVISIGEIMLRDGRKEVVSITGDENFVSAWEEEGMRLLSVGDGKTMEPLFDSRWRKDAEQTKERYTRIFLLPRDCQPTIVEKSTSLVYRITRSTKELEYLE